MLEQEASSIFVNKNRLAAQTELVDDGTIAFDIDVHQIVQHCSALTNHLQQTTTGMVVLLIHFQVFGQVYWMR